MVTLLVYYYVGQNAYGGFDFSGTLFVGTRSDDDFIGLAFSYQNDRNFYLLTWKQRRQGYWRSVPSFLSKAKTGIELKVTLPCVDNCY